MGSSTGRQISPLVKIRHDPPAHRPEPPGVSGEFSQTCGSGGFPTQPTDQFDAAFSGTSPCEAGYIDLQQRLLLEVAWEALEDAGATLDKLAGSATCVFVGGFTLDYGQRQFSGAGTAGVNYTDIFARQGSTFPLEEAAGAHRAISGRHTTGKVVLIT